MTAVNARVSSRLADREYSTNEQSFTVPTGSTPDEVKEAMKLAKLVADIADETFSLSLSSGSSNAASEQCKGENKLLLQHCAKLQQENQYKTLYLAKLKEYVGTEKFEEIAKLTEGSKDWSSVGSHSKID
jgi:hypothetical protein